LVDDLSNWYVRRSRRRFWRTDPSAPAGDSLAAQATLHTVLVALATLLAPFCPFVADRVFGLLTDASEGASVHLADWPASDDAARDPELEVQMALARRLSSLGRAARGEAGVKVRQPLARALVFLPSGSPPLLPGLVEDELNVDEVVLTDELGEVLRFDLVPNFKLLGPRLLDAIRHLKPALAQLDGAAAAATLEAGGTIKVELPSGPVELAPGEVELRVQGQAGYAVSRDGGEVVALDLALTDELRQRGLAREVVRQVQDLRKASGLEVSDRITLHLVGADALVPWFDTIGAEVLAVEVLDRPGTGEGTPLDLDGADGARAWVVRRPAG
jgi:isoleucyl-tRNA synthetase